MKQRSPCENMSGFFMSTIAVSKLDGLYRSGLRRAQVLTAVSIRRK